MASKDPAQSKMELTQAIRFTQGCAQRRSIITYKIQEKVVCMTNNCRSVVNKDSLIHGVIGQILREEKVDFVLLTETWYSDDKPHQFETSDFMKWYQHANDF